MNGNGPGCPDSGRSAADNPQVHSAFFGDPGMAEFALFFHPMLLKTFIKRLRTLQQNRPAYVFPGVTVAVPGIGGLGSAQALTNPTVAEPLALGRCQEENECWQAASTPTSTPSTP
jgi:hypothetical protein